MRPEKKWKKHIEAKEGIHGAFLVDIYVFVQR